MKLSSFAIILIFIVLITAGIAMVPLLTVKLSPSSTLPSIQVNYYWQGSTARVVEQEVTSLLEAMFNRVRGVKNVSSTSSSGSGSIYVEFGQSVNFDAARFEVATLIRQAYPKFPQGVSFPVIFVKRTDNERVKPLLTYTINAPSEPYIIQSYAEDHIKPLLTSIKGIHQIDIYGASPLEWIMEYDANQLETLHISTYDIQIAINQYLSIESAGVGYELQSQNDTSVIHLILKNHLSRETNFENIPVKKVQNRILYLKDIVKLKHQEQAPTSYFRINGASTINIVILATEEANQLLTSKLIKEKIAKIERILPPGYFLLKSYDATEFISLELSKNANRTAFTVVILLLFVLLMSKQFRYLLYIVISLIANLSIAVILYNLFRVEMHLYSMAGITVSLGLILNNSIVMIDHLKYQNNLKVFLAILASTLAAIAALLVVFLVDLQLRTNIVDFSIVIIINLSISLFVALFFIPALMDVFPLKKRLQQRKKLYPNLFLKKTHHLEYTLRFSRIYEKFIGFFCRFRWAFLLLLLLGFGLPVFLLPAKIETQAPFANLYNKTLGSLWYIENVKPILDKALGGTLRLFVQNVFENAYYGKLEKTTLYVVAQMPYGSTIDQMNDLAISAEKYLKQFKEIDQFQTQISNAQSAQIVIYFKKEYADTGFPFQLKELITQKAIDLGGADWGIYGIGEGFSNAVQEVLGYNRITLYGYNYDELCQIADTIKQKILENPRVKEISILSHDQWAKDRSVELVMNFDLQKLILQNTTSDTVYRMLGSFSKKDNTIANTMSGGKLERVRLVSKQSQTMDLWQMQQSPVEIGSTSLKLGSSASIKQEKTSLDICKENQEYRLILAYDYIGSNKLAQRQQDRILKAITPSLPIGYKAKGNNSNLWYKESKKQYWLLLLVIVIIFFICAILLESLLQPLAVILMIPLSYMGVFLTFYLFDLNFDQGGFAAFILLSGITVNSALYIINDFTILKRKKAKHNLPYVKLYITAYNHKIVPILLIFLSTTLGLVPFLLGGQKEVFWPALAAGTIGGLIFSIIGVFVFLPIVLLTRNESNL